MLKNGEETNSPAADKIDRQIFDHDQSYTKVIRTDIVFKAQRDAAFISMNRNASIS